MHFSDFGGKPRFCGFGGKVCSCDFDGKCVFVILTGTYILGFEQKLLFLVLLFFVCDKMILYLGL